MTARARLQAAAPGLALAAGIAVVLIVVIGPTVMPGVGFWDTAEFQTVPPILGTMHPTGYPTYVILGFVVNALLTPIGEPALRMNVMSLLSVIVGAVLLAAVVRRLAGRTLIAAAVGIGLGLTPVVWGIATRADAHALHLAFVSALVYLLVRWSEARGSDDRDEAGRADRWLVAAAAVFGLSAGNHSLTLLLAPPIALYVLSVEPRILRRWRLVAACLLAAIGTLALVYLELPLRAGVFRAPLVYAKPETWDGFWYIALAEQFRGVLSDPLADLPQKLNALATFAGTQLGILAFAVPLGFLTTIARAPRLALMSGSAFVVTVFFNAAYSNADIARYYLGPMLLAWLWLGMLAATIADQLEALATPARPESGGADADGTEAGPAPTGLAPMVRDPVRAGPALGIGLSAAFAAILILPTVFAYPARSFSQDRSGDTYSRRWLDAVFEALPQDAVIVSWWSYSTTLWYGQYVDGKRRDIYVVDDRTMLDQAYGQAADVVDLFYGRRPVFVMRANAHDLGLILQRYTLESLSFTTLRDVYRVVAPRTGSP